MTSIRVTQNDLTLRTEPPIRLDVIMSPVGIQGPAGVGLPAGGTAGQALIKASDGENDIVWATTSGMTVGNGFKIVGTELRYNIASLTRG